LEELEAKAGAQAGAAHKEDAGRFADDLAQGGERPELDCGGLAALEQVEVDVDEALGHHVVAVALAQSVLLVDEDEREDVHGDLAHLVAQVRLEQNLLLQLVLRKREGM